MDYSYAIHVLGSSFENSFFEHCTFTIESENNEIKFLENNTPTNEIKISSPSTKTLKLQIPDSYYQTTSAVIRIKYPGESKNNITQNITKVLNLNINGNYLFKTAENAEGIRFDTDTNNYIITLSSKTEGYDIKDLMDNYFTYSVEGKNISLILEACDDGYETSKLCEVTDEGKLKIAKSYVKLGADGKTPVVDKLLFTIKIHDNDLDKTLEVKSKLCITITPDFVIDLRKLENSKDSNIINVLNGQDIFSSDYISILAYNENGQLVDVNAETFKTVCSKLNLKVKVNSEDEYNDCTNGVVVINNYFEETNIWAQVSFGRGLEGNGLETTIEFRLNVVGYDLYFSQDKDFSLQAGQERIDTYESISNNNEKYTANPIALNYTLGDKLNLDKYFAVFSNGNSIKTNIYAVLVKSDETFFHDINETIYTDAGEYSLGFAYFFSDGKYIKLVTTDVKVNLSYLQLMCSGSGDIGSSEYGALDNDYAGYKMTVDLSISDTDGIQIEVKSYIRAFVSGDERDVVVILDGDDTNTQLDKVTVSEQATYSVYYIVDGVLIDTGYNLIVQQSE